jgi:hypothetical protein
MKKYILFLAFAFASTLAVAEPIVMSDKDMSAQVAGSVIVGGNVFVQLQNSAPFDHVGLASANSSGFNNQVYFTSGSDEFGGSQTYNLGVRLPE